MSRIETGLSAFLEAAGQAVATISIIEAKGSAPRGAGTQMLVSAHATHGTIGGGQLEYRAIAAARKLIAEVLVHEFHSMLESRTPYNNARYTAALAQLK